MSRWMRIVSRYVRKRCSKNNPLPLRPVAVLRLSLRHTRDTDNSHTHSHTHSATWFAAISGLFYTCNSSRLYSANNRQELFDGYEDLIQAPAADRNKDPILDVLNEHLSSTAKCFVLEVASGSGQHVVHFAQHFPNITFLPSDCDLSNLKSIQAYINKTGVTNVLQPQYLDITQPINQWKQQERLQPNSCDAIINANMIHISPWETCQGLMTASGQLLKSGGFLYMYGPFKVGGVISPESNIQFDQMLRSRNPSWGLRDVDDVKKLASQYGLHLDKIVDMPANNKSLIFIKR